MHTHAHAHTYTHTYMHRHAHMHTHAHTNTHTFLVCVHHVCVCVCVCVLQSWWRCSTGVVTLEMEMWLEHRSAASNTWVYLRDTHTCERVVLMKLCIWVLLLFRSRCGGRGEISVKASVSRSRTRTVFCPWRSTGSLESSNWPVHKSPNTFTSTSLPSSN